MSRLQHRTRCTSERRPDLHSTHDFVPGFRGSPVNIIVAVLCFFLLTAFTNPDISRSLASGAVGCPVEEIGISKEDDTRGVHSFTATCRGVDYFCTYIYPAPISCQARNDLTPEQLKAAQTERAEKMSEWTADVLRKATEEWERPKQIDNSTEAKIRIQIDGEGEILDWEWVDRTGVKAIDKSIVRAFENAEPFDPPPDTGTAFIGVVFTFPVSSGRAD